MAGFDASLDNELWSETVQLGIFRLKVCVMSYNEGLAKIQISRERVRQDGEASFAKLGRMTLEEITVLLPLIEKAKKWMEENKPEEVEEEAPAEEKKEEDKPAEE
ncbi:hypothetical protein ACFL3V_02330 [Nanoarchaeota archaeon]